MTDVIAEIAAERRRQVEAEGWSPEHDDLHCGGELSSAAACYAIEPKFGPATLDFIERWWPWERKWWKPKDRRRDLIRAAALIVAEIERLDRAKTDEYGRKEIPGKLEWYEGELRPVVDARAARAGGASIGITTATATATIQREDTSP